MCILKGQNVLQNYKQENFVHVQIVERNRENEIFCMKLTIHIFLSFFFIVIFSFLFFPFSYHCYYYCYYYCYCYSCCYLVYPLYVHMSVWVCNVHGAVYIFVVVAAIIIIINLNSCTSISTQYINLVISYKILKVVQTTAKMILLV